MGWGYMRLCCHLVGSRSLIGSCLLNAVSSCLCCACHILIKCSNFYAKDVTLHLATMRLVCLGLNLFQKSRDVEMGHDFL